MKKPTIYLSVLLLIGSSYACGPSNTEEAAEVNNETKAQILELEEASDELEAQSVEMQEEVDELSNEVDSILSEI